MLFTEQVIDCLHGVEGAKWNLYEDGVPVAHSTIPQSWQLKGLEFLAVLTLAADEACGLVDILRQVEWLSLVVLDSTHKVNGVEVCSLFEHAHVLLIVLVYLAALKYLQADSAILVVCEEWSTTWFSHVLNHSTNTYRTVEFLLEEDYQLGIFKFLDVILLTAEVILTKRMISSRVSWL